MRRNQTHGTNSVNSQPIFKTLSPADSPVNLQHMLPHYLQSIWSINCQVQEMSKANWHATQCTRSLIPGRSWLWLSSTTVSGHAASDSSISLSAISSTDDVDDALSPITSPSPSPTRSFTSTAGFFSPARLLRAASISCSNCDLCCWAATRPTPYLLYFHNCSSQVLEEIHDQKFTTLFTAGAYLKVLCM